MVLELILVEQGKGYSSVPILSSTRVNKSQIWQQVAAEIDGNPGLDVDA